MASRSLGDLQPEFMVKAASFLNDLQAAGMPYLITCTERSFDEQNRLYAQGRTEPGRKVTNAKGGQSAHNYGLAIDVYPLINGGLCTNGPEGDQVTDPIWQRFGIIARAHGLVWGGDWKNPDGPHVEMPNWREYI